MSTMNISLLSDLKMFVDGQVSEGQYGSTSEYVRELIRLDQDRNRLRGLLLDGLDSPANGPADEAYFASLRGRTQVGFDNSPPS